MYFSGVWSWPLLLFWVPVRITKYVDTGLANGKHDCTVWEYLHSQPDDWDSTIIMIEHAGMKEYFDGLKAE